MKKLLLLFIVYVGVYGVIFTQNIEDNSLKAADKMQEKTPYVEMNKSLEKGYDATQMLTKPINIHKVNEKGEFMGAPVDSNTEKKSQSMPIENQTHKKNIPDNKKMIAKDPE